MTREIALSGGKVALVSDCDYERISQHEWRAAAAHRNVYACRSEVVDGRRRLIMMHREVMNAPDGTEVDHRNSCGLDNTRENLRVCTHRQNLMGRRKNLPVTTSRFKGVYRRDKVKRVKVSDTAKVVTHQPRWKAELNTGNVKIDLGSYASEEQAARQYDRLARILFGSYARTNEQMGIR